MLIKKKMSWHWNVTDGFTIEVQNVDSIECQIHFGDMITSNCSKVNCVNV